MTSEERKYDLILLGPTGYTGKFTAEYIQSNTPTDLKWAIAGRNATKMEEIVKNLKTINKDRPMPDIEVVEQNVADLVPLAKKTRILISTVGPYWKFGSPVVEACATTGTHYMDVTGEIPWVYEMVEKYHEVAKKNKCVLISQCGLDSVPADILSYVLVHEARKTFKEGLKTSVVSIQKIRGGISGGTANTILTLGTHYSASHLLKTVQPFSLSPVAPNAAQKSPPLHTSLVRRLLLSGIPDPELGTLVEAPMSDLDGAIVHRSWALFGNGSSNNDNDDNDNDNDNDNNGGGAWYGRDFRFGEYMRVGGMLSAASFQIGAMLFRAMLVMVVLRVPFTGWLAKQFVPKPGEGPTAEQSKGYMARYKAVGTTESGQRLVATMEWHGNIYAFTAVGVVEAAMEVLKGKGDCKGLKLGGLVTPATLEMGYVERLQKGGIKIDVKMLD